MEKSIFIELDKVSKSFKSFKAVNELSLSVFEGDIYGFLGPNGAGKSTSIRMMLSLISPDSGKIKLFGHDLAIERFKTLSKIGALIEKPDFYKYLSARSNLELLGKLSEVNNLKSKIDEVLAIVGLSDRADSKVKTYSQGMKQRLGIAQTLLHDPHLIILDEPQNGLDPQGQIEMRQLIKRINIEKKITIVISSHILAEIEQIANRMIIINNGAKVIEGNVQELLNGSGLRIAITSENPNNTIQILNESIWSSSIIDANPNKIILRLPKDQIPLINNFLVQKEVMIYSIEPLRSLEDYFITMTKNAETN